MAQAAELFEEFTGHQAKGYTKLQVKWPEVALQVGKVDAIMYTTVRDGVTEHYKHDFKDSSRPTLISNFDGSNIGVVGGRYKFTERGIEDF